MLRLTTATVAAKNFLRKKNSLVPRGVKEFFCRLPLVRKIHFRRNRHAQFVFSDLFDSLRRLELRDFHAQTFVFKFHLLRLILRGDQCVTATCAYSAANDDCHCQNRKDDECDAATGAEQVIEPRATVDQRQRCLVLRLLDVWFGFVFYLHRTPPLIAIEFIHSRPPIFTATRSFAELARPLR